MQTTSVLNGSVADTIKKKVFTADNLPLLFSLFSMTVVMYYYTRSFYLWFALASLFLQPLLFRFYDFINRRHLLGGIGYVALLLLCFRVAFWLIDWGRAESPTEFYVWVLTPQSVWRSSALSGSTDFIHYICAMYLLLTGFVTSGVYYFTHVRYRLFMTFVLMVFPLTLFAKDGEDIPFLFSAGMIALYFAVMVYCRGFQGQKVETPPEQMAPSRRSAFAFLGCAVLIALAVPKPMVSSNRSYIENMLDFSEFTDFLLGTISEFTDTSSGGTGMGQGSSTILYYGYASEPLNLKAKTFTDYSMQTNQWTIREEDASGDSPIWQADPEAYNPVYTLQTVQAVAAEHPELISRYHMEEFMQEPISENDSRSLMLTASKFDSIFILSPTTAYDAQVHNIKTGIARTQTGCFYKQNGHTRNDSYTVRYAAQSHVTTKAAKAFLALDPEDGWDAFYQTFAELEDITTQQSDLFRFRMQFEWLHQLGRMNVETPTGRIQELAEQLTAGLSSDYDKASALEWYFSGNGFAYDLEFQPPAGSNAETFLFETKTGTCFDYATAMTLLCRSIGLDARYVEGYSLSEPYNGSGGYNYVIRDQDAHAFVEVYLEGYGWVSFDPTLAPDVTPKTAGSAELTRFISLLLLIIAAVVTAFYLLFYRRVEAWIFRTRIRHAKPERAISLLMRRICRSEKMAPTLTAGQVGECLQERYSLPCAELIETFERSVYGNLPPDPTQIQSAYAQYQALEAQRRIQKREMKKNNKRKRKQDLD